MGLMEMAKRDIKNITSDKTTGWGIDITLISPDARTIDLVGTHTKHHMGIDTDGNRVNSKIASIAFSEEILKDAGYMIRDANGDVSLAAYKVRAIDSTGTLCTYVVDQWFPDESISLIVCMLSAIEV